MCPTPCCTVYSTQSIPHICHIFSTYTILAQFFSTQKRVNCDKNYFVTKQRKLPQNRFCNKKQVKCHVKKFEIPLILAKFQLSPHLVCGKSEITLHVEKFQTSPHLLCIKIWPICSPPIYRWHRWQIWGMETSNCRFGLLQMKLVKNSNPMISLIYILK